MVRSLTRILLASLLTLTLAPALTPPLPGDAADAFSVAVPSVPSPPHLDGLIDDSWSKAVKLQVLFDFTYQRDGEPTNVYVLQDPDGLDVAFEATQRETIVENAETNGGAVLNDDNVSVALWPQGTNAGFAYSFSANARGARDQSSSENSAYSPQWRAAARRTPNGYVVTMHIPFDIMRSGGSHAWNAQFSRTVQANNSVQVWEHAQGQRNAADRTYAGLLTGIGAGISAPARPKPRLQVYALGEITNAANGGSTSRLGADVALPVTATSSLLASFHPDYSNVEVDQQTIAPSAFARRFAEVRPFFTQAASNFNNTFSCDNCPTTLYTPSIPTFRTGYAYEGTQGKYSFGAFDVQGFQRTDNAQTINYGIQNPSVNAAVSFQRVGVDEPGLHDVASTVYTGYENGHTRNFVYFNGGTDRGTFVTDPAQAEYQEYGVGHVDKNGVVVVNYQKIGAQFLPIDGYVQQPDVAGLFLFGRHSFNFGAHNRLHDIQIQTGSNNQFDHLGHRSDYQAFGQVTFDFSNLMELQLYTNYSLNETYAGESLPFDSNGFLVGYKTQTSTPSSIQYQAGPYYHGHLVSWSYLTTVPLRRTVSLALEGDENAYAPDPHYAYEPATRQWLERASMNWQFNRAASFAIGARRIFGRNLPNAFQAPDLPAPSAPCGQQNGFNPFDCVAAGNVSAAFHFLAAHNEWYVVYGNPNQLTTMPAFYVKWIRYIGAEKGT